tara:strand:+ start:166 stop:1746 length:1581 start_codon:yes stop_codon:yes gene_type:complete
LKVCILAAGTGSRNTYSKVLPKGFLPINNQPGITYLLDSIENLEEIIVAVGSRSELYKEFFPLLYPNLDITFVDIDNYEGPGSGPGVSLLECSKFLDEEFLLIPTDAYIDEKIIDSWDENWMGVSNVNSTKLYCLLNCDENGNITEIYDKNPDAPVECLENGFNGIAFIKDTEIFFESLRNDKSLIGGEVQVSNGFQSLLSTEGSKGLKIKRIDSWHDFGSNENYRSLLSKFEDQNLIKNDEFTYIYNSKVFKYNVDQSITKNKVERSESFTGFSPKIKENTKHFFSYDYIEGNLISHVNNIQIYEDFITFLKSTLFVKSKLDKTESNNFTIDCLEFYRKKTFDRLNQFSEKNELSIKNYKINGIECEPVTDLLNKIDWDELSDGIPYLFHGDLQPENIIYNGNKFFLIDWRDSFGLSTKYGDIYYDLAKLNHALLVSGSIVRSNKFSFDIVDNDIDIHYLIKSNLLEFKILLESFIEKEGYNKYKIDIITSLIYLNIAPLYDGDYSKFLFSLGNLNLQRLINKNS